MRLILQNEDCTFCCGGSEKTILSDELFLGPERTGNKPTTGTQRFAIPVAYGHPPSPGMTPSSPKKIENYHAFST